MVPIFHPPNGHILYNVTFQVLPLKRSDVSLSFTLRFALRLALVVEMSEGVK